NEEVRNRFGGLSTAPIVMCSLEFQKLERLLAENDWDGAGAMLAEAARTLERAGAGVVLLCSNQMHRVAPAIAAAISVPLLHLGDALVEALREEGVYSVGLLGTRRTLEEDFLTERFVGRRRTKAPVFLPSETERTELDRIIYDELCQGLRYEASAKKLRDIADRLHSARAEGIVLASSELGMVLRQKDVPYPLLDSTEVHALAAVRFALGETKKWDTSRLALGTLEAGRPVKASELAPRKRAAKKPIME
ncbi:MAG TPA: amino acid racemase, partial [Candidatus Didemnitutus sp.]|nr:amino acid racemase [Candidatus Didemnitutus sp.]